MLKKIWTYYQVMIIGHTSWRIDETENEFKGVRKCFKARHRKIWLDIHNRIKWTYAHAFMYKIKKVLNWILLTGFLKQS